MAKSPQHTAYLKRPYLNRLLTNGAAVRYLAANRPEYLLEFQSIVDMESTSHVPDSI